MARLTDPWFDASFISGAKQDGSFHHGHPTLDGAQGIFFWCPCGYGKPEYPIDGGRPHGVIVAFRNPVGAQAPPPNFGPSSRNGQDHPRWTMSGSSLADLTLAPSVDVGDPSCWHGFIKGGEVQ